MLTVFWLVVSFALGWAVLDHRIRDGVVIKQKLALASILAFIAAINPESLAGAFSLFCLFCAVIYWLAKSLLHSHRTVAHGTAYPHRERRNRPY